MWYDMMCCVVPFLLIHAGKIIKFSNMYNISLTTKLDLNRFVKMNLVFSFCFYFVLFLLFFLFVFFLKINRLCYISLKTRWSVKRGWSNRFDWWNYAPCWRFSESGNAFKKKSSSDNSSRRKGIKLRRVYFDNNFNNDWKISGYLKTNLIQLFYF